jgi:hypothetical protein
MSGPWVPAFAGTNGEWLALDQFSTTGLAACSSCPRLSRASTPLGPQSIEDVDGRDKPGQDVVRMYHPIGAAAAAKVSVGLSKIIAPVRSATRAKPLRSHHRSSPSMIATIPVGLRKVK